MPKKSTSLKVYKKGSRTFQGGVLETEDAAVHLSQQVQLPDSSLYISPGWIDMHTHVYVGGGELGISPELAGLQRGVHLLIDAGSAGAFNIGAFRDYIAPSTRTKIKAFLNISAIGLASGQPYHDMRLVNAEQTAQCIIEDAGAFIVGVKVLASRIRVEQAGLEPLRLAIQAAEMAGCPVMAHLAEGPPYNEETMPLLRKNDIISHCFHGDKYRTGRSNLMWNKDGSPTPPLRDALERGVILDVGHGSASLRADIAISVVRRGLKDFIISTDLHSHNINGPVFGLAETMSKFLSFGMDLGDVLQAVTTKPAQSLGLKDWGNDLSRNSTIFHLRKSLNTDPPLRDALGNIISVENRIEPVAVIVDGTLTDLVDGWRTEGREI